MRADCSDPLRRVYAPPTPRESRARGGRHLAGARGKVNWVWCPGVTHQAGEGDLGLVS